jgi:hypothetical protein
MVLPFVAAALGAGLSYASGSSAADLQQSQQQTQWGFQDQLANQFALDPLMQMALRNVTQQGWDPREMMEMGSEQIGAVGRRRAFDAQRNLAKWGFQPGSQMHDFMRSAQEQQQGRARDDLRGLITMQSPMSQLQNQLANAAGYTQALGPQIGMAGAGMGSGGITPPPTPTGSITGSGMVPGNFGPGGNPTAGGLV